MHEGTYGALMDGDDSGDDLLGYEGITEILGDDSGDDAGAQYVGDEFSGDDSGDDMVGAAKRRRAKSQAVKQALMRKRIGAGALLRSLAPRSSREYVIGLGSTTIPGGAAANIGVQPQVLFRPERIVIPSTIAADFLITDIKVGKNSQLVAPGAIPATVFAENAFGVRLKMDTSQIAQFVTISVQNQNAASRNFQGAIIGPAVE
jgi:hypothetical protein